MSHQGDLIGIFDKVQDVIPDDGKQSELMLEMITKGEFCMRILHEQYANILKMGPMSQVMSLIPGFSNTLMAPGD